MDELKRVYRKERARGVLAKWAIMHARTMVRWNELDEDCVRLRVEPDELICMDDLKGDVFNPLVNTDIQESKLLREEKEFEERVYQDGVVGIIGEYLCPCCGEWVEADACWGFVGDDWKGSGYDHDVMRAAVESYDDAAGRYEADIFPFVCAC